MLDSSISQADGPYRIVHGDVWWYPSNAHTGFLDDGGRHVCDGSGMLAVAFDADEGILHKHGSAERVEGWVDATRKKLAQAGATDLASGLGVVVFPPTEETVAELNACIATSGRIGRFVDFLERLGIERPELARRPHYPR